MGDIVCGSETPEDIPCLYAFTANLVRQLAPGALLLLGDLQYESGSAEDFAAYFEPTFGMFRDITYPSPGNHEYVTKGARGYFDYFNGPGADSGRAGARGSGYYSFDLGGWHLVALNSNCREVAGGCGARSPQAQWLRADLEAHRVACTLAFWHNARFSSGGHGDDPAMRDIWPVLQEHGADLVLQGHDHDYERFRPLDARGKVDEARGIRSFVVGTGGKGNARFERPRPGSVVRENSAIGVLRLVLHSDRFEWRFVPLPGSPVSAPDSGSAGCRAAPDPRPAPQSVAARWVR